MLKNFKIVLGAGLSFLLLNALPVFAFDGATLSEIKISSKDNYSYKILLKADKDVPVEKSIDSDNKIVINLKNTRSAEFVNTIYNNSPEIDDVIVQTMPNDNVRIFIKGLNISSSKVILDSRTDALDFMDNSQPEAQPQAQSQPQAATGDYYATKTKASNELSSDAPVINLANSDSASTVQGDDSELLGDNQGTTQTVKNSIFSLATLKKVFSKKGFDWMLRIFAIIFIGIGIFKLLNKPKNVTIDLSSENMKNREIDLYKAVASKKELLSKSLGSNYTREKISNDPAYGATSQMGLREYRNSQLPPQRNSRPNPQVTPSQVPFLQLNASMKAAKTQTQTRKPSLNSQKVNQRDMRTAKTNIDNVKFLESMAAIYQKSGRDDLARNIKQSIINNKSV